MSLRRVGGGHSGASGACGGRAVCATGAQTHASSALHCTVRTHTNGFCLFFKKLQQSKHALPAKNLQQGQVAVKKAAERWGALPWRERESYNRLARAQTVVRTSDNEKRYNLFNLTMKLLAEKNIFAGVGSEKLNAQIARQTARRLSPKAAEKLRRKYSHLVPRPREGSTSLTAVRVTAGPTGASHKANEAAFSRQYRLFHYPSMRFFSSFTEMQRGVCPTAQSFFTNVCLLERANVSRSTYTSTAERFHLLPPEAQDVFSPITDEESAAFEEFCARPVHCASQDPEQFNIILLAALFRRLPIAKPEPAPLQQELYRRVATLDRTRDGPFYKVQRCLIRARSQRSSDYGEFLFHQLPEGGVTVPRGTYGIQQATTLDDVSVAKVLAATRHGQSVYDDVLCRAAVLRPARQQQLLRIYDVAATSAERKAALTVAASVKPVLKLISAHKEAPAVTARRPVKKTRTAAARKLVASPVKATARRSQAAPPLTASSAAVETAASSPAHELEMVGTTAATTTTRPPTAAASASQRSKTRQRRQATATLRATAQSRASARSTKSLKKASAVVVASTAGTAALPSSTVPAVHDEAGEWDTLEETTFADEDDDALLMSAGEADATAAADDARRHAAAMEAIAAIGLRPAKASQRARASPVTSSASTTPAPRASGGRLRSQTRPHRRRDPLKAAKPAPRSRARRQIKATAATVTTASSVTTAKPARNTPVASARPKPRETREERQQRVKKMLLSGRRQRILHRHQASETPKKSTRVRRAPGKSQSARTQVATSLTNALRAQLSSMQG